MLQSSTHRFILGSILAASLALTAGPASADKCTSKKLKAIAKKEQSLLKCQAKVALKGDPSLATDWALAQSKLGMLNEKLDNKKDAIAAHTKAMEVWQARLARDTSNASHY